MLLRVLEPHKISQNLARIDAGSDKPSLEKAMPTVVFGEFEKYLRHIGIALSGYARFGIHD